LLVVAVVAVPTVVAVVVLGVLEPVTLTQYLLLML
jgi:hypothetical protein